MNTSFQTDIPIADSDATGDLMTITVDGNRTHAAGEIQKARRGSKRMVAKNHEKKRLEKAKAAKLARRKNR